MAKPKCTLVLRAVGTDGEFFVVKSVTNSTEWHIGESLTKVEVEAILAQRRSINVVIRGE